jgi:hypothetical protein
VQSSALTHDLAALSFLINSTLIICKPYIWEASLRVETLYFCHSVAFHSSLVVSFQFIMLSFHFHLSLISMRG